MITIYKSKPNTIYDLVKNGHWHLKGQFTKWNNSEVLELELTLEDNAHTHYIKDVNYCVSQNVLEIHVFIGGQNTTSRFSATKADLNGMTLAKGEKVTLNFIDYIKDTKPVVDDCFEDKSNGGTEMHPERKKGNILQGGD